MSSLKILYFHQVQMAKNCISLTGNYLCYTSSISRQLSQPNFNPIRSWCDHIMQWNPTTHHPTTTPPHHHRTNFEGTSKQPMNLIFGMQPYFGLHQILNMKTKVVVTWPSLPLGLCNFNPTAKTFNALPGNLGSSKNHPKTSLNWLWHNSKLT